jgi:cell division protein CrgA
VPDKTKSGPGKASNKGKSAGGRTTSKVGRPSTAQESGRYTPPIPKSVRRSPPWYGVVVLALLIGGVAVIVVNYLAHIPWVAHGSAWGLVAGLLMIFAGFLLATRYR